MALLVAMGLRNRDIAARLGVREGTVRGYLSDLAARLAVPPGMNTRVHITRYVLTGALWRVPFASERGGGRGGRGS